MARAARQPVPERQLREIRMVWKGPIAAFMRSEVRVVDLEGAIRSGKTTACVWKVFTRLQEEPGLQAFLCRWTDGDTDSKLRPVWRAVCDAAGIQLKWNADEQYDELPNGSRAYIFGLKSADQVLRYSKLRGLTVAVIYNDQTEELPHDIFLELCGRLSQPGFNHQAIFSPNPTSPDHWLAQEFPADNHISGRVYVHLSIYDNAHNLTPGTIEGVIAAFPPGHAKHRPMVLGLRGLNVIGTPCYKDAFDRTRHEKPIAFNPELPLCEGYDFGKHHPCWVVCQFPLGGGIAILGGVMGQNLWLEDFLPLVQQCRSMWFGHLPQLLTCCDPAGTHDHAHGTRDNALQVLKRFYPEHHRIEYRENSNAPDVRIALVERLAGHMRRRTPWGEAFSVDGTRDLNGAYVRWLRVDKDGADPWSFVSDGCEAGYVWDSHFVSVGSKQMRKPKRDGWYEHGQACGSADTEVLTERGWVMFPEVTPIDSLATVHLPTNQIQYQLPSRLVRNEHSGQMRHFHGKLDALFTPDHRMVVYPREPREPRYNGPRPGLPFDPEQPIFSAADDVRRFDRLKLTAEWSGTLPEVLLVPRSLREAEKEVDPGDWAEFLGWWVAEGWADHSGHSYGVQIAQVKTDGIARIERLLDRLPWKYTRQNHGFAIHSQQLWNAVEYLGLQHERSLPSWIRWVSPDLIHRFLDAAIAGDGHVTPPRGGHQSARIYYTASPVLAGQIQELFMKIGRSAGVASRPPGTYTIRGRSGVTRQRYLVQEWTTPAAAVRDSQSKPTWRDEHYEGYVYCATVPNGTLIVRRNGRPLIVGNCLEYLELNFGGALTTEADEQARAVKLRSEQQRQKEAQRPPTRDLSTGWMG